MSRSQELMEDNEPKLEDMPDEVKLAQAEFKQSEADKQADENNK